MATKIKAKTCMATSILLSLENNKTVTKAEGPAKAGIAKGTIKGSCELSTSPKIPPD